MILANGCSHTHGTDHAVKYNYRDELWPNIMGKLIGDEDVLNIARPGDASQGIAESTIYWLETNSVKPDMVVIQWTYSNRGLLPAPWNPYHYKASNDGSSYKFYKREGPEFMPYNGYWVQHKGEGPNASCAPHKFNVTGIPVDEELVDPETKTFWESHPDSKVMRRTNNVRRLYEAREAITKLPMAHTIWLRDWALAQNHVWNYCKAHDIKYYWWTVGTGSWKHHSMSDYFYLKPKTGEMFGNLPSIEPWLERQGIIGHMEMYDRGQRIAQGIGGAGAMTDIIVDEHRGKDGHKFIGEMCAKYILTGENPDPKSENRELLKQNMIDRPNCKQLGSYKDMWRFANNQCKVYRPSANPTFIYD